LHELSITENLLALALQHAEQAGATRIVRLNLVIGDLSSVVDESVQFYWDMLAKGTIAEGAELNFRRVAGRLRCVVCGSTFELNKYDFSCPECGSVRTLVAEGEDFRLESIDVEGVKEVYEQDQEHSGS
jgi:hydrogenase nickel incorporation protein HypA/HybF